MYQVNLELIKSDAKQKVNFLKKMSDLMGFNDRQNIIERNWRI